MARRDARESGRIILAHGEVTGHMHEVVTEAGLPPGAEAAQFFEEPDGTRTLVVLERCLLRHDEHDPIALDPAVPAQWRQGDVFGRPMGKGVWQIVRQSEYEPEGWRVVAD